ncbi:MAG: A/G-specific adenine glycosylase [Phycisphaeraceae bacterium]|nr:A/G-specific adenine glycosylase [Phycisphaeraceae bacterium]
MAAESGKIARSNDRGSPRRTTSARSARQRPVDPQAAVAVESARALQAWFNTPGNARALPWRDRPAGERDAYVVLVAEAMLQQTQVSRIADRLPKFLARFPTVSRLAAASQDDVLAEWSGLGYYRRARNLHAAARMVVDSHGGELPNDVESLRSLPGVGRYTAGAIASLAFDKHEPIVDGNVARVLLRLHGKKAASDDRAAQAWLWEQSTNLVRAAKRPGVVNEAIMELGATVCLPAPAAPRCERCPLASLCVARAQGTTARIPTVKSRSARKALYASTLLVRRRDGALLVEQRPGGGMWSCMWQAVTVERHDRHATAHELSVETGTRIAADTPDERFIHRTTHRDVHFEVWTGVPGRAKSPRPRRGEWVDPRRLSELALSNAQRRILFRDAGLFHELGPLSPRPR